LKVGLGAIDEQLASCIICEGQAARFGKPSATGERLDRCRECGHVRRSTSADRSSLSLAVATESREPSTPATWVLDRLPSRIREAEHAAILDVGCWDGQLLGSLPEHWTRRGIEPNPDAAARARAMGLDITATSLEAFADDGVRYDVVLMLDVLEHLPDPTQAMARVQALLVPGGSFLALTGDGGSLAARIFGDSWYYYAYPEHVSVFTRESAIALLKSAAFRTTAVTRTRHPMSDHVGDLAKVLQRLPRVTRRQPKRQRASLSKETLGLGLPALSRIARGKDHLWIAARKMEPSEDPTRP
jgi:SAM-dependent methyltransferase